MINCGLVPTRMSTSHYLTKDLGEIITNVSQYKSILGALHYVTLTKPDIAYSVNKLSQFLSSPRTILRSSQKVIKVPERHFASWTALLH